MAFGKNVSNAWFKLGSLRAEHEEAGEGGIAEGRNKPGNCFGLVALLIVRLLRINF